MVFAMPTPDLAMPAARLAMPTKGFARSIAASAIATPRFAMSATRAPTPSMPAMPAVLAVPAHVTVAGGPGRFAVIRHAETIPRIPGFRFALWITSTMGTSEVVHSRGLIRVMSDPSGCMGS
jgi:hypothetical protein